MNDSLGDMQSFINNSQELRKSSFLSATLARNVHQCAFYTAWVVANDVWSWGDENSSEKDQESARDMILGKGAHCRLMREFF